MSVGCASGLSALPLWSVRGIEARAEMQLTKPGFPPFQVKKCKRKLFGFPRSFNKGG